MAQPAGRRYVDRTCRRRRARSHSTRDQVVRFGIHEIPEFNDRQTDCTHRSPHISISLKVTIRLYRSISRARFLIVLLDDKFEKDNRSRTSRERNRLRTPATPRSRPTGSSPARILSRKPGQCAGELIQSILVHDLLHLGACAARPRSPPARTHRASSAVQT